MRATRLLSPSKKEGETAGWNNGLRGPSELSREESRRLEERIKQLLKTKKDSRGKIQIPNFEELHTTYERQWLATENNSSKTIAFTSPSTLQKLLTETPLPFSLASDLSSEAVTPLDLLLKEAAAQKEELLTILIEDEKEKVPLSAAAGTMAALGGGVTWGENGKSPRRKETEELRVSLREELLYVLYKISTMTDLDRWLTERMQEEEQQQQLHVQKGKKEKRRSRTHFPPQKEEQHVASAAVSFDNSEEGSTSDSAFVSVSDSDSDKGDLSANHEEENKEVEVRQKKHSSLDDKDALELKLQSFQRKIREVDVTKEELYTSLHHIKALLDMTRHSRQRTSTLARARMNDASAQAPNKVSAMTSTSASTPPTAASATGGSSPPPHSHHLEDIVTIAAEEDTRMYTLLRHLSLGHYYFKFKEKSWQLEDLLFADETVLTSSLNLPPPAARAILSAVKTIPDMSLVFYVIKKDWMTKRGDVVKNWKRRFAILICDENLKRVELQYYESETDTKSKGSINLKLARSVHRHEEEVHGRRGVLDITLETGRTYSIAWDSPKASAEWFEVFKTFASFNF